MKRDKRIKLTIPAEVLIVILSASFVLPIFKSGGKRGLNFWEWLINHTIWAEKTEPEYIPREDYTGIGEVND